MTYFLIWGDEDGDHYAEALTEEELLERLNEHYWGEDPRFAPNIPNYDLMYWADSMVLIRGEIVVPKPKQVTTVYEI